jgi:site-specific DNA-methyltransferase (adenine-specific)
MHGAEDRFRIRCGDARRLISAEPPCSIDCVVTSPPFWRVRDFGHADQLGMEESLDQFLANLVGTFGAIRPKLRPTATMFVEFGDAHNNGRIGRSDKKFLQARNEGIAAHTPDIPRKSLLAVPWRFALRMIDEGWVLRNVIVWQRPGPIPEAVVDRLTHSWTPVFVFANTPDYYFNLDEVRVPHVTGENTASWQEVVRRKTRDLVGEAEEHTGYWRRQGYVGNDKGRNPGDVWTVPPDRLPKGMDGDHPARFPEALVAMALLAGAPRWVCTVCNRPPMPGRKGLRPCSCNAVPGTATRTPGVVLDPFAGSGTVPAVALRLGYHAIAYDIVPAYCGMMRQRCIIAAAQPPLDLDAAEAGPERVPFLDARDVLDARDELDAFDENGQRGAADEGHRNRPPDR